MADNVKDAAVSADKRAIFLTRDSLKARLGNVLGEIEGVLSDGIPQKAARVILELLRHEMEAERNLVSKKVPQSAQVPGGWKDDALVTSSNIANCMSALGILRRAGQTRNAFEFYRPLGRLAENLLHETDVKLILSSEWDYSPFIRHGMGHVDDGRCIYLGLPASEAGNPLIIPLVGHELGHALWRAAMMKEAKTGEGVIGRDNAEQRQAQIKRASDLIAKVSNEIGSDAEDKLKPLRDVSKTNQMVQEVFCDFVGVRIFGESYLFSFHHLLSPNVGDTIRSQYPRMILRFKLMVDNFKKLTGRDFEDRERSFVDAMKESFIDEKAGIISGHSKLEEEVCTSVKSISECAIAMSSGTESAPSILDAKKVRDCFKRFFPAPANISKNVTTIVLGGWMALFDSKSSKSGMATGHVPDSEQVREMVLKSIELLEIEERMGGIA